MLIVKCKNNEHYNLHLTINKEYSVIKEYNLCYILIDDLENEQSFSKDRFEIVKEDKKVKEYTLQEIFKEKEGTKFTINNVRFYFVSEGRLRYKSGGVLFNCYIDKELIEAKYTKDQTTVTFLEAWKSYQEGKIIKSLETNSLYKKNEGKMFLKMHGWNDFKESQYGLSPRELEEQWIIYKSEDDN